MAIKPLTGTDDKVNLVVFASYEKLASRTVKFVGNLAYESTTLILKRSWILAKLSWCGGRINQGGKGTTEEYTKRL